MAEPTGRSFYDRVTVNADAYPGSAHASWTFNSLGLVLRNTGANPLLFSHDGVTDHGRIQNGEMLTFRLKWVRQIWFKRASGAASNDVDVTAWG